MKQDAGNPHGSSVFCVSGISFWDDGNNLIDYSVTDCFKMQMLVVHSHICLKNNGNFSGIYGWQDRGILAYENTCIYIERNLQVFIPAGIDDFKIVNKGRDFTSRSALTAV